MAGVRSVPTPPDSAPCSAEAAKGHVSALGRDGVALRAAEREGDVGREQEGLRGWWEERRVERCAPLLTPLDQGPCGWRGSPCTGGGVCGGLGAYRYSAWDAVEKMCE